MAHYRKEAHSLIFPPFASYVVSVALFPGPGKLHISLSLCQSLPTQLRTAGRPTIDTLGLAPSSPSPYLSPALTSIFGRPGRCWTRTGPQGQPPLRSFEPSRPIFGTSSDQAEE